MPVQKLRSVLYVDDDPDICVVVQATLRALADLDVQIAQSGEQAIEMARRERPDLVLMDVMMPGLDGPSTLKRMQECEPIADIPVIFLTAKVMPAEVAGLLKQGAIGVIGKPFDPTRLCGDVLTLWNNAAKAGAIIPPPRAIMEDTGVQLASLTGAQMDTLKGGFLARARVDVIRLRKMLECVREGDEAALKEVERVAHSLHGTAAMFGFASVSACGGAIEDLIEEMKTAGRSTVLEPHVIAQLSDRTERLAREVEVAGCANSLPM